METITLTGKSKRKMALIVELAKNLGISVQKYNEDEEAMEEKTLFQAMEEGKTGEYVDTKAFLEKLKR